MFYYHLVFDMHENAFIYCRSLYIVEKCPKIFQNHTLVNTYYASD